MFEFICSDVDLSDKNTLSVQSRAEFYCACKTIEEVKQALAWAKQKQVPVRILGGGSNALLNEQENGLIIHPEFCGIHVEKINNDTVHVRVGAGENWHNFVSTCVKHGWHGLENLALIPGSVGAAPIQNIGAYGVEVAGRIIHVDVINIETGDCFTLTNNECQFAYRDSIFKTERGAPYLVYQVHFSLSTAFTPVLDYPVLQNQFDDVSSVSAQTMLDTIVTIRRSKLPDPQDIPNAGSFFKNPIIEESTYKTLKEKYDGIVAFDASGNKKKLAAAWLIDQCGWKAKQQDGVGVHQTQALVIVNPESRPISSVMGLAEKIKEDVYSRFGVLLEVEPQFLRALRIS